MSVPETNIAPENGWLEDQFPVGAMLVAGRVAAGTQKLAVCLLGKHVLGFQPFLFVARAKKTCSRSVCLAVENLQALLFGFALLWKLKITRLKRRSSSSNSIRCNR